MRIRRARKRGLHALRSRHTREPASKRRIGITSIRRRARTLPLPWGTILLVLGRARSQSAPHFDLSPTSAPDTSAARIPGVWSVPLTTSTAHVIIQMAYTRTPPMTPTDQMRSWRKVVHRWSCVIASGSRSNLKRCLGYAALCGCSALCYTGGFEGAPNGGQCKFSGRHVGSIGESLSRVLEREVAFMFVCGFERVVQWLGTFKGPE